MSLDLKAKEILETGDIKAFEKFVTKKSEKIHIQNLFHGQIGFPIILLQTYRNAESLALDQSKRVLIEDYKHCLRFLVEMGCNLNIQDEMGKTFAHWTVLLHCLEMLATALELGCDALLQDSEGETIVHLAIRYNDQMALETIKLYSSNSDVFEAPSETSGATPLIYAVQIGAVDIVKKLLQLSVNVNAQENNQYKRTALHYSLFTENEEIFTLLLRNQAKADIKDYKDKCVIDRVVEHPQNNFLRILTHYSSSEIFSSPSNPSDHVVGYSPIILACKNKDYPMLCHLVEKDKDNQENIGLLVEDNELRTSLHHCADNPDTRCAEKLMELEPKLIGKKDINGFTALHLATIANNIKLVQLLIRNGCDIKEKDNDGHTSLHWAVVCGAAELIDILLKSDPEIRNIIDSHGATPLHYATQSFLSPEGSVQGPIAMEKLLRNNKNFINCVDYENRTPLLWAASLGITDCCQLLLEAGADINHRDSNGLSALHCAASRGHYDVVDLLVNTWSMPIDVTDNNLCTPLFYAVTLKHMSIIHFLIEQRSNPNHQDIKGRSVAHCAALKGYCDILEIIKNMGGSLTLKNKNGDLPLHEASETGKLDVCKLLLEKMTESNEKDKIDSLNNCGFSPLHEAAQNNYNKICQLLLSYGANINLLTAPNSQMRDGVDRSNLSPLDLATDSRTIKLLKEQNGISSKELLKSELVENNQKSFISTAEPNPNIKDQDKLLIDKNLKSVESQGLGPHNEVPSHSSPFANNELEGMMSLPNPESPEKKGSVLPNKGWIGLDKIGQPAKVGKPSQSDQNSNQKNKTRKISFESVNKTKPITNKKENENSLLNKKPKYKNLDAEHLANINDPKINKKNKNAPKENSNDNENLKDEVHPISADSLTPETVNGVTKINTGRPAEKISAERNNVLASLNRPPYSENKRSIATTDSSKGSDRKNNQNNINNNNNNIYDAKENHKGTSTLHKSENLEQKSNKIEDKLETRRPETKKLGLNKPINGTIRGSEKAINTAAAESTVPSSERSLRPTGNVCIKIAPRNRPMKDKVNGEMSGTEVEIQSTAHSNQTVCNSMSNHICDYRRPCKSKPFDLFNRVVKSVKEYETVRDRMRSISDQRRLGMFQGYSKAIKLDKITKNPTKLEKPKKIQEQYSNSIELPELTMFDPNTLQNSEIAKKRPLFPVLQSKEEQIRSAYEGQSSVHTLALYSYLP